MNKLPHFVLSAQNGAIQVLFFYIKGAFCGCLHNLRQFTIIERDALYKYGRKRHRRNE